MSEKESIIEKVRKLLRLAERAGTPEESQLAFARASELLYKHKIERSEVGSLDEKREIAQVVSEMAYTRQHDPCVEYLMPIIAENFACVAFCERLSSRSRTYFAGFLGFKEDAEIAKVVFENAFAYVRNHDSDYGTSRGERYYYGRGFCFGLRQKFEEMRRSKEQFAIVMKPPTEATDMIKGWKTQRPTKKKANINAATIVAYEGGLEAGKSFNPHSTIDGERVAGALKG